MSQTILTERRPFIGLVGDNYIDELIQSDREMILMLNITRIPISDALEFAETARLCNHYFEVGLVIGGDTMLAE